MDIQLIRNRLVEELANLPDVTTPEIQSYALTSAVLVRRITEALNITDLRIQDAWRRETSHDLARVLSKLVHYQDFGMAVPRPPHSERDRYAHYVYLRSRRTERGWAINLGSYFDYVRCFAYDDVFVVRYLLRRIVTLLSQVVRQPERDFDQYLLAEVVDRMYDSFALLGKLVRRRTLVVPTNRVISGYPQDRPTRPGPIAERVPYGQMFAGYGTAYGAMWGRSIWRPEKHRIGGSEGYMVDVLRLPIGASNAEHVFFKLGDLLRMFENLAATDWNVASNKA